MLRNSQQLCFFYILTLIGGLNLPGDKDSSFLGEGAGAFVGITEMHNNSINSYKMLSCQIIVKLLIPNEFCKQMPQRVNGLKTIVCTHTCQKSCRQLFKLTSISQAEMESWVTVKADMGHS